MSVRPGQLAVPLRSVVLGMDQARALAASSWPGTGVQGCLERPVAPAAWWDRAAVLLAEAELLPQPCWVSWLESLICSWQAALVTCARALGAPCDSQGGLVCQSAGETRETKPRCLEKRPLLHW